MSLPTGATYMTQDAAFPATMVEDIRTFLETTHPGLPPGRDIYPEVFEVGTFFPLQRQAELAKMIRVARSMNGGQGPRSIIEIGADKGGGFYHWLKCLPSIRRAAAVEIRGTPYREMFERAFPEVDFFWAERGSQDARVLTAAREWLAGGKRNHVTNRFDVLFIDGDKNHFDTDFLAYRHLMNPRGIVFMHDIQDGAPRRAFDRVTGGGNYPREIILDKSESHAALTRNRAGIPADSAYEGWLRYWEGHSCGVGVIYLSREPYQTESTVAQLG